MVEAIVSGLTQAKTIENGNNINLLLLQGEDRRTDCGLLHRVGAAGCPWVFCFTRWDLGFMFSDWKGYLMIGVYGIITLSIIYATFDSFLKLGKANHGIPAFSIAADRFIVYDKHGPFLSTE